MVNAASTGPARGGWGPQRVIAGAAGAIKGDLPGPSEQPNGALLNLESDVFGQAVPGAVANIPTGHGVPEDVVCSYEMTEAVEILRTRIDENVDIGIRTSLVAGI